MTFQRVKNLLHQSIFNKYLFNLMKSTFVSKKSLIASFFSFLSPVKDAPVVFAGISIFNSIIRFFSFLFFFVCATVILWAKDMLPEKKAMLELLIERGITNQRVLDTMQKVPRENFVPEKYKAEAYEDGPLPIGYGQTISQPYIVAYMTQELNLTGKEKVLEIGFGSGYQTAILAELSKEVYAIEILEGVYEFGKTNLLKMGYKNVFLKLGDGRIAWNEKAPFDCILAAAAPESLPEELIPQLKEGGRMIIPIGEISNQILFTYVKRKGKLVVLNRLPVRFVPMTK